MATLSGKDLSELRSKAQQLDASLQMGKAGLTDAFVEELQLQLDENKLVKVRLLRSSRVEDDTKGLAEQLAEATNSVLVETRGHTCVLYKP